jgi:hypothetical protein
VLIDSCIPNHYLNKLDRPLNIVTLLNPALSLSLVIFETFYLNKFAAIREVDIKTVACFAMTKQKQFIFLLLRVT